MNYIFKISLVLLLVVSGCNGVSKDQTISEKETKIKLTGIKLTKLDGSEVNLEQYKNKTLFLNFWATWCKPCLQEMPSIKSAIEILNDKNIVFLFASDESVEQIENFKSKNDYNFNYVKAGNMEELNIMALPTTFIFDKNGNLVFNEMGYRKWDEKENIDLILNNIK